MSHVCFNRRREANPLATRNGILDGNKANQFQSQTRSQSPGDFHDKLQCAKCHKCFNRRREANPLATNIDLTHFKLLSIVSIADAKPIPWRLDMPVKDMNSLLRFQSQTRSQSPGDGHSCTVTTRCNHVSIADAKPIPWRHRHIYLASRFP